MVLASSYEQTPKLVRGFLEDVRGHEVMPATLDEAHRVDEDGEGEAAAANVRRKDTIVFPVLWL